MRLRQRIDGLVQVALGARFCGRGFVQLTGRDNYRHYGELLDLPLVGLLVRDEATVRALAVPDLNKLKYVFDAVTSIRRALDGRVPLIGFSGSPWTLACYMVEGAGSDDYRLVKSMLYSRPDLMHHMLAINADAVAAYLNAQIDAGAQALMIFDSWGGVLADGAFQEFSLAYTRRVLRQLKREHAGARIPHIVFTKGGGLWVEEIAAGVDGIAPDVVGLDWTMSLAKARRLTGDRVALLAPGEAAHHSFTLLPR